VCKTLEPVTLVNDLEGLFGDSKIEEVFSAEGI